jgi:hypothetical protein
LIEIEIEIEDRARRTGGTVTKSTRRPCEEPSRHRIPVAGARVNRADQLDRCVGETAAEPVVGASIRLHL